MFGIFRDEPKPESDAIKFFNTATGQKEVFRPLKHKKAAMYSCGPTVYDHIHIGNLRSYLLPDLIKRLLKHEGYQVRHVINFTDFGHLSDDADAGEDKMMKALKRAGKPITLTAMREVAEVYMDSFKKDNDAFGNLPPTAYTPASDYVREEIALIKTLMDKGYTYETSDGIYFDISKFPKYGVLGNVDINAIKEGARVEANPEKRHPADFALWKNAFLGFDAPWGKGFPGWHIECTAMIFSTLGRQIDIHTGGEDLQYTHHNGEIAQAEAATGKKYVQYWMHNAFITIDDKKIAKSEGNGITLRHLKEQGYSPEDYRYWLLTAHYRTPANFSFNTLHGAKQALFRLRRHLMEEYKGKGTPNKTYTDKFLAALRNDLDTPKAIAVIWEIIKDRDLAPADKKATIQSFEPLLGLDFSIAPSEAQRVSVSEATDVPEEVLALVHAREEARKNKRFDEADELREAINLKGYTLEDSPKGPRISKA